MTTGRVRLLLATALTIAAVRVHAHSGGPQTHGLPQWTFDGWITLPLGIVAVLYAIGALRLRSRSGTAGASRAWQSASFAAGWSALAGALVSPLHWWGEHLFTFHMIEHEIVMAVAAPLLVLAWPAGVLMWGLPATVRAAVGRAWNRLGVRGLWHRATQPATATLLHGLAIWVWHVPRLFDAAVASSTLHRLQHLSFLGTALLFWWAMLRRSPRGAAVWHLFVTMTHTGILGALMALAPRVLYRLQTENAPMFGLTPLEDQQLAGVIMWIPAGTVYAGAAIALAALWLRESGEGEGGCRGAAAPPLGGLAVEQVEVR